MAEQEPAVTQSSMSRSQFLVRGEQAHTNPAVQALWEWFAAVCDYETLANLPESQQLFSPFELLELS